MIGVSTSCWPWRSRAAPPRRHSRRATASGLAGSASISGSVFVDRAGATKQPARRVRVTLTNVARTSPGQTTTTDDRGAFSFRGGLRGPVRAAGLQDRLSQEQLLRVAADRAGTPIVVKDGETIAKLSMTLARGGVITGVVRDTRGRPMPGANVRL